LKGFHIEEIFEKEMLNLMIFLRDFRLHAKIQDMIYILNFSNFFLFYRLKIYIRAFLKCLLEIFITLVGSLPSAINFNVFTVIHSFGVGLLLKIIDWAN